MKHKIEKNAVQETLSFHFTPGNYARSCTQTRKDRDTAYGVPVFSLKVLRSSPSSRE